MRSSQRAGWAAMISGKVGRQSAGMTTCASGFCICSVNVSIPADVAGALLAAYGGYIGNDSGASHLAAFLGLPATVIFGPADPRRWTPVGRAVEIVRPELECRPCFETEKANCGDPECLTKTTPQQVIQAFYRQYGVF